MVPIGTLNIHKNIKNMIDFKQLAQQYKSELLDRVMPFWMEKPFRMPWKVLTYCWC